MGNAAAAAAGNAVLLLLVGLAARVEARPLTDNRGNSSGIDSAKHQYISSGNNVRI